MKDKLLTLLGFARRSGKLVSGTEAVKDALKHRRIHFLYVACDSSESSQFGLRHLSENVPVCRAFSREELTQASGMQNRNFFGITDKQMAKAMLQEMEKGGESFGKDSRI